MAKDKRKQEPGHHLVSPRLILGEQWHMLTRLYYVHSVTYSPVYIRQAVYHMKYLVMEYLSSPLAFGVYWNQINYLYMSLCCNVFKLKVITQ